MPTHIPRFLRWIEEAEGRRLREWALLDAEAPDRPRAAAPPSLAVVTCLPPFEFPPRRLLAQRSQDDGVRRSLLSIERKHRA